LEVHVSKIFLEVEIGQPRPASYDPAIPIYERKTHRIDGVGCAARREARRILADGAMQAGGRTYPRMRIAIRARRQLPCSVTPKFLPRPLYEID
jgi:hypothetical protein